MELLVDLQSELWRRSYVAGEALFTTATYNFTK